MEKWADYLISQVGFNSNGKISRVRVHKDNGDKITHQGIYDVNQIISSIKSGYTYKTIVWNYKKKAWSEGAEIHIVKDHLEYIRTDRDDTAVDNLENLIRLY
jgi:hypothetical protein